MRNANVSPDARHEIIARKAYELYLQRGRSAGHELEDWLAAEKIVDGEIQGKRGASRAEAQRESQREQVAELRQSYSKSYSQ